MATLTELRKELKTLTGTVDRRLSKDTIVARIERFKRTKQEKQERQAAAARKQEQETQARQATAAQRGMMSEFIEKGRNASGDSEKLYRAAVYAQRAIIDHADMSEKLAKEFATNPNYAMSWADKYFEHAGAYQVAVEFQQMFEGGVAVEAIMEKATRQALYGASNPERSTSAASNLTAQMTVKAWARMAGYLDAPNYFLEKT